jgi:cobalamin biosynthesis Mg chelatase CobN
MKSLLIALLGVATLAAPVTDTFAQATGGTTPPSGSASGSASGSVSVSPPAGGGSSSSSSSSPSVTKPAPPSGSASGSVGTEARRDDGDSALPRASVSERTTIFGLSPTAAVLIAAALLIVVVLAIVAMTRSTGDYIDQRRM